MKDLHGRYIETNRVFLDRVSTPESGLGARVGIQCGKFEGRTDFDIFPADYARKLTEEDRGIIESKKPSVTERHIAAGANERWIEVTKAPVFDESGAVTGTVGIARDITERKLGDAQRMARDMLLRAALVKEVHHRIKNNLQGVIALMQQLATEHPGSASLLDVVVTRVNAIASMHGLYGATGEHELRLEQILLRLVSSLRVLYADLPVQLSICSSLVSVRVTESEIVPLALVVNELIINAIKHSRSIIGGDPIEIVLERTANCGRIVIHSHAGRLPGYFDFDSGVGLGTGLSLVKSLLPPEGAVLRFENRGDRAGVKAELTLCPPVIASSAAST
jgi:PAS domain S-box-containing protein